MQYNLYKINDYDGLLLELNEQNYLSVEEIVQCGKYTARLYYSRKDNPNISWQSILNIFQVDISISRDNLKGVIILDNGDNIYALTYGLSSSLVQKFCDTNFAFEIAKKIEVSAVKRKASKILNGNTNGIVKTLNYSNIIVVDKGESVINLELIPREDEGLGKKIAIGKSLSICIDVNLNNFHNVITKIEEILEREDKRTIPLLIKVLDSDLKDKIWDSINTQFKTDIMGFDFAIEELNILGSSIYFNDNFEMKIAYERTSEDVMDLNTATIKDFIVRYNIPLDNVLEEVKVKYYENGTSMYSKSLKQLITANIQLDNENYVSYDGNLYYYNKDFYDDIIDGLKRIEILSYDSSDDKTTAEYKQYLITNNFADIKSSPANKVGKMVTYKEEYLNKFLCDKYGYENIDRKLANIDDQLKFRIEVADLGKKEDIVYAVKIGSARDFCYAIDQSNLTIDVLSSRNVQNDEIIKKYSRIKKVGLWLFIKKGRKINSGNDVDISKIESIMFLNKLVEWSNRVHSADLTPVIRINYFD